MSNNSILDSFSSIEIKYKGKKYRIWKIREPSNYRPVGEEDDKSQEIIVKDYKVGKWDVTVNVNGEIIIVGWGPVKHLTFWGSIVLLAIIIYVIWRRSVKKGRGKMIKN